jgi:protein O-GlcNAc transferase
VKLNPRVVQVWAAILSARPTARLLLKTRLFETREFGQRLLHGFAERGIDPQRVELLHATATRREHLATYARVDIALDTFPYAGATTTCEAL